jgi:LPXTG-site transpeptidase (sortase) family protein
VRKKQISVTARTLHRVSGATALAVVACALIAFGLGLNAGNGATDDAVTVSSPQSLAVESKTKVGAKLTPVSLKISAIDVKADITRLGLNSDRTVQVPKDADDAGWYTKGPAPGENGSSVILGHRDSKTGPAVFYRLNDLERGDKVAVKLSDDSVAHYQVVRVAQYANEDFPAPQVYAESNGRPALNLVTCGGRYDRDAGGYQSNIVVFTKYLWATGREAPPQQATTQDDGGPLGTLLGITSL